MLLSTYTLQKLITFFYTCWVCKFVLIYILDLLLLLISLFQMPLIIWHISGFQIFCQNFCVSRLSLYLNCYCINKGNQHRSIKLESSKRNLSNYHEEAVGSPTSSLNSLRRPNQRKGSKLGNQKWCKTESVIGSRSHSNLTKHLNP